VIAAISDIDVTGTVDIDAMRASQSTFERIAIGTISQLTIADKGLNPPGIGTDDADRMAFGIGEVDIAVSAE
jgi:hypothetical protein